MSDLSKESGVDIRFLKALGMQESGIHIGDDGKVSSWDYTGDEDLGTEGSFGIFHGSENIHMASSMFLAV